MDYQASVITHSADSIASVNKVLRNTYQLLSMTVAFAALLAFVGMQLNVTFNLITIIVFMAGAWFLPGLAIKHAESTKGLLWTFAYTGWLGFWTAPLLNVYVGAGMGGVIFQALAATALVFLGLSGYVLTTKKDFSFMTGFLVAGMITLVVASLGLMVASMFGVNVSMLSLALSAVAVLLFSGLILWQTSAIVNGGEDNYIRATVMLFASIHGLFIHLLNLLGAANDE